MGISTLPLARSTTKVWKAWSTSAYGTVSGARVDEPFATSITTRIYYLGNTYVFGTNYGNIAYSTDGKNWSYKVIFPTSANITAIAYNGTTWVVVGSNNYCYSATSLGGTWTARTSQITGTNQINDCVWVGGSINLFILTGNQAAAANVISSSPDGITWTGRLSIARNFYAIAVNTAQTYIATGTSTATANDFGRFSTNGTTWTSALNVSNSAGAANADLDYLPHVDKFVLWNWYRQSPANLATRWDTNPGAEYQTNPTVVIANSVNSVSVGNLKRRLVWDSANSVYYTIDQGNGIVPAPMLYTWGNSDLLVQTSTTSTKYYSMNLISAEPIPTTNFSAGTALTNATNLPAFGYGNGIWVVASLTDSGTYGVTIWSTAT